MSKLLLVAALVVAVEPLVAWGPWWRTGVFVVLLVAAAVALFFEALADALRHG
jgi:hypothetical protein